MVRKGRDFKTTMNKDLRIPMLEDTRPDAELILRELDRQGIHCTTKQVLTEPDFLERLHTFRPDLNLANYSLPSCNGLAALASVRKTHPEMPFIFVSSSLGEGKAIAVLHCGATDYLLKPRMSRLGPTVERALRERRMVTEHKRSQEGLDRIHTFLLNLGHDYAQNVPALELRLTTRSWWRRARFSSSKLRRDFRPASAKWSMTISHRIMRQRIPANFLEAQHFQTGCGFCQRQGSPVSLLSGIFPRCPSLLPPARAFPTGSKTIEPANAGKNETP
jgi:DNA-binding response OmpR family regulator